MAWDCSTYLLLAKQDLWATEWFLYRVKSSIKISIKIYKYFYKILGKCSVAI